MSKIFIFLSNPWVFMPLFIVILAIIGWLYWTKFHIPVQERRKRIDELTEQIKNYNSGDDHVFSNLDELLGNSKDAIIVTLWKKYRRNVVKVTDEDDVDHVWSTIDADEYFNLVNASEDLSLGFWQNFASVFTGLGILGTFMGLTFGLAGLDTSTSAGLQSGIRNLLGGTKTAFLTSIIGIIVALVFNWRYSIKLIKNFSISIDALADKLDELFPRKTIEELLYTNSEAVKEQTAELQDFNTQLATTIGDTLHAAMTEDVKPVLEELLTAINNFSKTGGDAIVDGLSGAAGKELKSFASTLEELQEGMKATLAESQKMNEENNQKLREAVAVMVQSLQTATDEMVSNLKGADEVSRRERKEHADTMNQELRTLFTKLNENLQETIEKLLAAGGQTTTGIADNVNKLASSFNTIVDKWESVSKEQQEQMVANIEQIRLTVEQMLEAVQNDRKQAAEGSKQAQQELQKEMETLLEQTRQMNTKANDELYDVIQKMVATLKTSTDSFADGRKANIDEINKQIQGLVDNVEQMVKNLGTGTIEAAGTWENHSKKQQEELAENIKTIRTALEDGLKKISQERDTYIKMLHETTEGLQQTIDSSKGLIEQAGATAGTFADAAKLMNEAAQTMQQTMTDSVRTVMDATRSFNSQVGTTVLALQEASDASTRSIATIKESLDKTEQAWNECKGYFDGLDQELGNTFTDLEENLVKYNKLTQGGLSDYLRDFDKNIRMAIGQIYVLTEELQDTVERLKDKN